jgi:DNA-binding MarR family transcriptional regulator
MPHRDNVGALIREVKVASDRMKRSDDALHRELGLTPAMRAVVEALVEGRQTVPTIARRRSVSRQHVQALVDGLVERGHCALEHNPGHARSPLVVLTERGRAVLETLRECEQATLAEICSELPGDVVTAVMILRRLNAALLRRADS